MPCYFAVLVVGQGVSGVLLNSVSGSGFVASGGECVPLSDP